MRVKRYIVDSMPDALQHIRMDLGKDAVILNTKEIRSGGFLGMFSKKKIEVIAATDTPSGPINAGRSKQPAQASRAMLSGDAPSSVSSAQTAVAVLEERIASLENPDNQPAGEPDVLAAAGFPVVPRQHGAAAYSMATGAKAPVTSAAAATIAASAIKAAEVPKPAELETAPSEQSENKSVAVKEEVVLAEIRAMKQMMQKLAASGVIPAKESHPVVAGLKERLLDQEIRTELADELLAGLEEMAEQSGEELTEDFAKKRVKDQLSVILGANTHKSLSPDTRIVHFVGPTGVGKTTTIAKLAAEQVLKHKRKVGFITSDTYRIAAVDQLKTYATILGIPLEVVFSPQDLKKAIDALHDRDIIFMDTAGRNFRNEMYVSELNALLHTDAKCETYLVLSLTTKYKDMRAIAENFSPFKLDKVLFTKRDETDTFGPIVNLLHEFPLQLSYITNGQNVPDDFAIADENDIMDLILEE